MAPDDHFARRLDALARRSLGGPASAIVRLTGGASLALWAFEAGSRAYVLRHRVDARFAEAIDLTTEAAVVVAAGAAGVPVARVVHVLDTADELGEGFVATREPGEALGRHVVADPALDSARRTLTAQCGAVLAAIHRVPVETLPPLAARTPAETIEQLTGTLDRLGEPRPVFEAALAWLRRHCPAATEPRLVHGDFRTGNFLVTPAGLGAVLDWEGAHLGDPMADLGWLCMPAWRFGRLDLPVGGFGRREALFAAYERASGATVDAARVRWWEIGGMLRWGVICMAMARAFLDGDRGVERGAVGRRASETELELMVALTGGGD